jgi:hypothetical protein
MSVNDELELETARARAIYARLGLASAEANARWETVAYIDVALRHHLSWDKIAVPLKVSATAARRYYDRNRKHVHNGSLTGR